MTATGQALGAITVINATATGRGCAIGVEGGVKATWDWNDDERLSWGTPGVDSRLAEAVYGVMRDRYDAPIGAAAATEGGRPPARGLKTSSSAAAALITAAMQDMGLDVDPRQVCRHAVQASVAAGVTLTGAYDDQVAVVLGGCHVTDNADGRILASIPVEPWHVAIWIPEYSLPKEHITGVDTSPIREDIEKAESMLWRGDLPGALTANGAAFSRLYAGAGLPIKDEPCDVAMKAGAVAAGLSGTGPAVAALFEQPTQLPAVKRGEWVWTRVVEAT